MISPDVGDAGVGGGVHLEDMDMAALGYGGAVLAADAAASQRPLAKSNPRNRSVPRMFLPQDRTSSHEFREETMRYLMTTAALLAALNANAVSIPQASAQPITDLERALEDAYGEADRGCPSLMRPRLSLPWKSQHSQSRR